MLSTHNKIITVISKNRKIIFRHGIVSCICATTELISFAILNYLLNDYLTFSYILAFLIATLLGFILHSKYTFSLGEFAKKSGVIFFFQASFVLIIGYTIFNIFLMAGFGPIPSKVGQLITTFIINVSIGKKITFKRRN